MGVQSTRDGGKRLAIDLGFRKQHSVEMKTRRTPFNGRAGAFDDPEDIGRQRAAVQDNIGRNVECARDLENEDIGWPAAKSEIRWYRHITSGARERIDTPSKGKRA